MAGRARPLWRSQVRARRPACQMIAERTAGAGSFDQGLHSELRVIQDKPRGAT